MDCPFCKNPLNEGATVCGHCRAYKGTKAFGCGALAIMLGTIVLVILLVAVAVGFYQAWPPLALVPVVIAVFAILRWVKHFKTFFNYGEGDWYLPTGRY